MTPSTGMLQLTHLAEPHHAPAFWARVEMAMPDFEKGQALVGV